MKQISRLEKIEQQSIGLQHLYFTAGTMSTQGDKVIVELRSSETWFDQEPFAETFLREFISKEEAEDFIEWVHKGRFLDKGIFCQVLCTDNTTDPATYPMWSK